MTMYRGRPSLSELRHTKPCKFFQRGQCMLSAERCSFAHVKIPDLHPGSRRYACAQAQPEYHQYFPTPMVVASGPRDHFGPPSPLLDDMYVPTDIACLAEHYPHARAHAAPPNTPFYTPHALPPYAGPDAVAHLILRDDGDDVPSLTALSSPSAQSSSVPDVDGDADVPAFARDQDAKHAHPAEGMWSPPPPGAYPYMSGMLSPAGYSAYCSYMPLSPPLPPPAPMHAPLSPKKVARAFKTKNCKYFKKDGTCPKGEKCTFIHDPALARARAAPSPMSPSPSASASSAPTSPDDALPRKPVSDIDELRAKGIYPITWRVIGGGVMMGGQRAVCEAYMRGECADGDDCRFAHPDDAPRVRSSGVRFAGCVADTTDSFSPLSDGPEEASAPQSAVLAAQRPEGLKIAIPAPLEDLPDVSPIAQRVGRTSKEAERPSRPHSTPPRMPGVAGRRVESEPSTPILALDWV